MRGENAPSVGGWPKLAIERVKDEIENTNDHDHDHDEKNGGGAAGDRIESTMSSVPATSSSLQNIEGSPTSQLRYLPDDVPMYVCAKCGAHLALQDELISKAFSGRDGKAYLFFSVLNARLGAKEDRQLLTGVHTVADLHCEGCGVNVGWTYLKAWESSQRYKEDKFIIERAACHKVNGWS
ncbi:hypothetical protein A4X13_0g611 [Tilletia indica]|uniref:Uncharacterized protein n=2 Tax=Tilletia TaxID=13289 RepID=A0A177TY90_9BASI|nr:hypothetical protein A4X13_0g611 [Tilletia indica]